MSQRLPRYSNHGGPFISFERTEREAYHTFSALAGAAERRDRVPFATSDGINYRNEYNDITVTEHPLGRTDSVWDIRLSERVIQSSGLVAAGIRSVIQPTLEVWDKLDCELVARFDRPFLHLRTSESGPVVELADEGAFFDGNQQARFQDQARYSIWLDIAYKAMRPQFEML